MEHSQNLELQTLQIEPSNKSDNLCKLVWMRVRRAGRLTSIKNRPNYISKSSVMNYSTKGPYTFFKKTLLSAVFR